MRPEWRAFNNGIWEHEINVRDLFRRTIPLMMGMILPCRTDQKDRGTVGTGYELSKQEREAGGVLEYGYKAGFHDYFSWPGIFRQGQRNNCWIPDT